MSAFTDRDMDMFARFGLSPELVSAAKIERVTDDEAYALGLRFDGDKSGLFFPYHLPDSPDYVWGRVRRDNPEMEDGKPKNKYIGIPGRHHLYLPPGAAKLLADRTVPVCFVESEKAVLAVTSWATRRSERILAVATGGVWGWRGTVGKTAGANGERRDEKGPLSDLALFRGHPASVLFDSNVAARSDLRDARNAFSKTLAERNCAVRLLDLPVAEGVNGPDDFLAARGDEAFALVLDPAANWKELFDTREEFENAPPLSFAIENFLQRDAVTAIAGLSGHSKTLLAFSITRALLFGPGKLWDLFPVMKRAERVVYYIPEATRGPVYHRIKLFGLEDEVGKRLFIRTLSKGQTVPLADPRVLRAAKKAHNIVDTGIRFMDLTARGADDVAAAAALSNDFFELQRAEAETVIALFHSPKSFRNDHEMELKNMIRGSGEFGASLATAWGIKQVDKASNIVHVQNIKPRDFEPCGPFQLIGRPYIDKTGDFALHKRPEDCGSLLDEQPNLGKKGGGASADARATRAANIALLRNWLEKNPNLTSPELREMFDREGIELSDVTIRKYKSFARKS